MKKVAQQTSRVHWQMGQALLPEHFYAQEEAIREEIHLRLRMNGVPAWGVGTLQWDNFQLLKGIVSVQEMTLVLQSGTLIDIPGNTAPAFLNLNATGATRAPVFVHLQSDFDVVAVGRGDLSEEGIERIVQRIELSTSPYSETAAQSFKLAELEASPDGSWSLRSDYLPPMIQVGSSPFFEPYALRLQAVVRTLRQVVLNEIQDNHLASESQVSAKQALRAVSQLHARLVDLAGEIRPHPYELFAALRSLYLEICIFRDVPPDALDVPYAHEDLAAGFDRLLVGIEEQVQITKQKIPYTEFVRREGMLVATLPRDVKRAKEVFVLVQKPQVSAALDLTRVKLASESRIHTVYERALRGIPYHRLESPPFHHGLSATVDFYAVAAGQEWDYALREGKIVLFDAPQLQGSRMYLYWRVE